MAKSRQYDLKERKGKMWQMSLEESGVTFNNVETGMSILVSRREAVGKIELQPALFEKPLIVVSTEEGSKAYSADKETVLALERWMGPPTVSGLEEQYKRQFYTMICLGVVCVLLSLTRWILPYAGQKQPEVEPIPLAFGAAIIAIAVLSKMWTLRIFLIFEALWVFAAGGYVIALGLEGYGLFLFGAGGALMVYGVLVVNEYRKLGYAMNRNEGETE